MKKFLESLKKCFSFLKKHGVVEPMFDANYPEYSREYVEALTRLADNKVNQRFLMGPGGKFFPRYRIHPLKGISLFYRWLCRAPARNA